jgi:hypothetical protein
MIELDNYRLVYNQFVTIIVNLHNCHVLYSREPSIRNGRELRKILREMRVIEKTLWDSSIVASKAVSKARGRGRLKKEK